MTPKLKAKVLKGIKPWSWYIANTPSNWDWVLFPKKPSAEYGPWTNIFSWAFLIAGIIAFCSSLPIEPFSPAWGFKPKTAILGLRIPKSFINELCNCSILEYTFSWVMLWATSFNATCPETTATLKSWAHNSISGLPPNFSPKYSVCPG